MDRLSLFPSTHAFFTHRNQTILMKMSETSNKQRSWENILRKRERERAAGTNKTAQTSKLGRKKALDEALFYVFNNIYYINVYTAHSRTSIYRYLPFFSVSPNSTTPSTAANINLPRSCLMSKR